MDTYTTQQGTILITGYPDEWDRLTLDRFLVEKGLGTPKRIKLLSGHAFVTFEEANFVVLGRAHSLQLLGGDLKVRLAREKVTPQIIVDETKQQKDILGVSIQMVLTSVAWRGTELVASVMDKDLFESMRDKCARIESP